MRCCTHCGVEKSLTEFDRVLSRRKNGPSVYVHRGLCKDCRREWHRQLYRANAAERIQAVADWRVEHREAKRAHSRVEHALERGHLVRPERCEACGETHLQIDAHHEDYSRPLVVEWLCRSCHRFRHSQRIAAVAA